MRNRFYFTLFALLLAAAGASLAQAAHAASFTCRIAPDGKTVEALNANPYQRTTSSQENCQVATARAGSSFQTSCTKEIAPGKDAVVLCSKSYGKGRLTKVVGGSGDCINPVPADEKADKDDDASVQELIGDPAKLKAHVREGLPPEAQKMFDEMNKTNKK